MTAEEFDAFVERANWRYAKTYEHISIHWYVVRKEFNDDKTFEEAVQFIRDNSTIVWFRFRKYQCYFRKGYKYWSMGNPVSETRIINRNKI